MSRRREARQQEAEDFLDANPQLVRYTTHIEVGRDEGHSMVRTLDVEPYLPPYVAVATVDGEPADAYTSIDESGPDQTLANYAQFPGGEISAGAFLGPFDGDEVNLLDIPGFDNVLSLGENGFGVAQGGFYEMVPYVIGAEMPPMGPTMGNNAALDGDEIIFLDVFVPKGDVTRGPMLELGGKELGIDFKVLSGSGTVRIELFDFDEEGSNPLLFEMAAGGRRRGGQEGHLDAEMAGDSAFDLAAISVTGTLEIAVTGIDLSNNFEPFSILA